MKLVIVGATGGIGQQLVDQAMRRGDEITAIVRDPTKVSALVRVIAADLLHAEPSLLEPAFDGADAVLSALGTRSKSESTVTSTGTRSILAAMASAGVRRIVAVSAAPVSTVPSPERPQPPKHDPGDGFFMRHLLSHFAKAAFGWNYVDLAVMEDLLRGSDTDWTVIRPPRLTNGPTTNSYRTAIGRNVRGGSSISRADVAALMLAVLDRPETIRQSVGIAR